MRCRRSRSCSTRRAHRRLERLAASVTAQVRQVLRAKIVLAAATGASNSRIARELALSVNTVRKWRGRFASDGLDGLCDARRSGRPPLTGLTCGWRWWPQRPAPRPVRRRPGRTGPSPHRSPAPSSPQSLASQVGRILAGLDLKPHKVRGWLTRRDNPDFWDRIKDICDLYRDPPKGTVVLSIDEKTAIQARSRRHPGRPARPGQAARQEFEYRRHGTASLVAALDVTSGEVLTETIARNDAAAFTAFLDQLDALLPREKEIHVVLDNGSSHTAKHTKAWLAAHPRWHVHWTPPHASWINQVELFFSAPARRVLRHGDFASRDDLIEKMDTYVIAHNETTRPYR